MRPRYFTALACAGLALSGCVTRVVETRPAPVYVERPAQVYYVPQPPPEPIREVQPPPPGPPELWIWQPGHYRWDGARYVWHHGVWEHRPHRQAVWVEPRWEHRPGGWVFIEGRFE